MTTTLRQQLTHAKRWLITALYAWVVYSVLLWVFHFYRGDTQFTSLITIGDLNLKQLHPRLLDQHPAIEENSAGYDGQMYAQIALVGDLKDAKLGKAVDNLGYRARRLLWWLIPRTLGLGNDGRVLLWYSLQNVLCWTILAVLLLRWFPATSFRHFVAWCGVLLSMGSILSIRNSLVEGPTLLLLASGMRWFETGKKWRAACALSLAGLGRETTILAGAIVLPKNGDRAKKTWVMAILQGALIAGPICLWAFYLWRLFAGNEITGVSNFTYPLVDYAKNWRTIIDGFSARDQYSWFAACTLVALTTQALWFAFRFRPDCPWWRIGAVFTLLFCFLGIPVWEGYPGAAARVLLPLTLAFNILLVREKRPWFWLVLGNLSLLCVPRAIESYRTGVAYEFYGSAATLRGEANQQWRVAFSPRWNSIEQSFEEYWRWSSSPTESITVTSPLHQKIPIRVSFHLKAAYKLHIVVRMNGEVIADTISGPKKRDPIDTTVVFSPGPNVLSFECPEAPPQTEPATLPYVCLRNLKFEIRDSK